MKTKRRILLNTFLIIGSLTSCTRNVGTKINIVSINAEESIIVAGLRIPAHVHDFQCVVDDAYLKSNATIDEPAKYYKTCECGAVSSETFDYGSPIKYEICGEPLETNYSAIFAEYDSEQIVKTIEDIICPLVISLNIGNYKEVVYKRYTFNYESTYLDSSRIVLSGAFTIPYYKNEPFINFVDVDSHATLTQTWQAPSLQYGIFTFLALTGALVIECDLLGFGRTNSLPVDYHCSHLAAKNTVDGIIAAINLIENELGISLEGKKMFNTGYSQGGYDALALMRYMEVEATDYEKEMVHFEHNFCGSGAYDLGIMFEDSIKNDSYEAPEYILMGLLSAYDFHPEIFGAHTVEDFLTDYGKRFIQPVRDKNQYQVERLKAMKDAQGNYLYNGPKDFFTFEYDDPDPELLEILNKFSALETLVNGDWLPKGKLTLFYLPKDNLVSPRSSYKALYTFRWRWNVNSVRGIINDHALGSVLYYLDCALRIKIEIR